MDSTRNSIKSEAIETSLADGNPTGEAVPSVIVDDDDDATRSRSNADFEIGSIVGIMYAGV